MQKVYSIWFKGIPVDLAQRMTKKTMIEHIGIEMIEAGADFLRARMPVDSRTRQPAGVLHGGASAAFAETLASWGASLVVDPTKHYCVGLEINANHVRPVRKGFVYGIARPIHLGRTTQIWEVRITEENDKLICISRITMAVLTLPAETRST